MSTFHTRVYHAPLDSAWAKQLCYLTVPLAGDGLISATCDGVVVPCQVTGRTLPRGREVALRLSFARGQQHTVSFTATDQPVPQSPSHPLVEGLVIGDPRLPIILAAPTIDSDGRVRGPFTTCGGYPVDSSFSCRWPLRTAMVQRLVDGPLFEDWEICYLFGDEGRSWTLRLRCHRSEPLVEVHEQINLGMDAEWSMRLNPAGAFDRIHRDQPFSWETETQPIADDLSAPRPKDVLFRLQMPPIADYVIPNNGGWCTLSASTKPQQGMLGVMGLSSGEWQRPVENIILFEVDGGRTQWRASLNGGARHWMLFTSPLETTHAPDRLLPSHRLQAQFNAFRLDEHLDLDGSTVFDAEHFDLPGIFTGDWRARAHTNAQALVPLKKFIADKNNHPGLRVILSGSAPDRQALIEGLFKPFSRWVHQFHGWREGVHDYNKNVIGFSRQLRGLLISYELLRKEKALDERQIGLLNSYLAFAARRIMDVGRWPHEQTWLHPDHPDSTRDLYTYPGEHKPDRLVWTNCLPNFQNDPISALAHLSCVIPGHPDAARWQRFALDILDGQLSAYIGKSGAHEESINYALYTLSYFTITFRMLKHRCGIDYFQDPRFRNLAAWLVRILGPYDPRCDAVCWPALGNSVAPQNQAEYLLVFADHLSAEDPLRTQCLAAYNVCAERMAPGEHYPLLLAIAAPIPHGDEALAINSSETMDEVGVAMRHQHRQPDESLLLQKIGFGKDHYEGDESSFSWYAKGQPFSVDIAGYGDDMGYSAHNLVEIPDADSLRRGYLADHHFTPSSDYTRIELPITLKLSHGKIRSFAETDGPPIKPLFHYIGDNNPVGPKTWVTRQLLWGKPDWLAVFDRVHGALPHRWNLHHTSDHIACDGRRMFATGRHGVDLEAFIQHPAPTDLEVVQGMKLPLPEKFGKGADNAHRQAYIRLVNKTDGTYRVLLFAREPGREVSIRSLGATGFCITTPVYTDIVFIGDRDQVETITDPLLGQIRFVGRAGWMRRTAAGVVSAVVSDGSEFTAFGLALAGRGPWAWNLTGDETATVVGTPRPVSTRKIA